MRTPPHAWLCPSLASLTLLALLLSPLGPSSADVVEPGKFGYTAAGQVDAAEAFDEAQFLMGRAR